MIVLRQSRTLGLAINEEVIKQIIALFFFLMARTKMVALEVAKRKGKSLRNVKAFNFSTRSS